MEIPLTVRLPARLHEELCEQAASEDRSVASLIRIAIRTYLKAMQQ